MAKARMRHHCTNCGQSFSRKEHLRRHQVMHSQQNSFRCEVCLRAFGRRDILRRHQLTHQRIDSERIPSQSGSSHSTERKEGTGAVCDNSIDDSYNGQLPYDCRGKHTLPSESNALPPDLVTEVFGSLPRRTTLPQQETSPLNAVVINPSEEELMNARMTPLQLETTLGTAISPTKSPPGAASIYEVRDSAVEFHEKTNSGSFQQAYSMTSMAEHSPQEDQRQVSSRYPSLLEKLPWDWLNADLHFDDPAVFDGAGSIFNDNLTPFFRNEQDFLLNGPDRYSLQARYSSEEATDRYDVNSTSTANPYENSPFVYHFKTGPVIKVLHIIDFLHNRAAWMQVTYASPTAGVTGPSIPRIVESIRDSIAARVHGMLSRLIETRNSRKIPHQFLPLETIETFFMAYRKGCASLYPIVHPTSFSESRWDFGEPYADVGLFLTTLMTLGCLITPVEEARSFSVELGYLILQTINESSAMDETHLIDKWVISAWMMMMVYSAWSGVQRHMELAEAFRGVLSALLVRRGFFQATSPPISFDSFSDWSSWTERERNLRLCQVWYMIDQEISLLYCVEPSINFTNIRCPMPVSDDLFFADSETGWADLVCELAKGGPRTARLHPPSLSTFHILFMRPDFLHMELSVTPLQLRLLLGTIQTQVIQYSHSHRWLSLEEPFVELTPPHNFRNVVSTPQREELENALLKWDILAKKIFRSGAGSELQVSCFITSQLLWLELYICFADAQLVIGKEGYECGKRYLPQLAGWVQSSSARKAIAHAANILKILQTTDVGLLRPIWWPLALSRVATIFWCWSVGHFVLTGSTAGVDEIFFTRATPISLNDPNADHGPHGRIIQPGEGIPCVQDAVGTMIPLHNTSEVFGLCLNILADPPGQNSPLLEGIRLFLLDLTRCGIPYQKLSPVT